MDIRLGPLRITTKSSSADDCIDPPVAPEVKDLELVSANTCYCRVDKAGNIVSGSHQFAVAAGIEEQQLAGNDIGAVVDGDEALLHQLLSQPGHSQLVRFKVSPENWYSACASEVQGQTLAKPCWFLSFTPANEQVNALNESKDRLDVINQATRLLTLDSSGHVLNVSQGACRLLNKPEKEIVGLPLESLLCAQSKANHGVKAFWQHLDAGHHDPVTLCFDRDGKPLWCQLDYVPYTQAPHPSVLCTLTDVNQQHLAEAMQSARRNAIESNYLVARYTIDGTLVACNDKFAAMMGSKDLTGSHHSDFVDTELKHSNDYHLFWHRLIEGESWQGNYVRVTANGTRYWLLGTYMPIFGPDGAVQEIAEYAIDVTDEQAQVQDAKVRFDVLDQELAVIETDQQGLIRFVSKACAAIIHNTVADMLSTPLSQWFPEGADEQQSVPWSAFFDGMVERLDLCRPLSGAEVQWLRFQRQPQLSHGETSSPIAIAVSDITAEKAATDLLEGKLQAFNRSQAIIEFELDGTIVDANENFLSTMGYELKEIVGKHHKIFLTNKESGTLEYRQFWQKLATGQYHKGEIRRVRKDGTDVWLQASYNPVFARHGKPVRVVKIAADVTAEKHKANELQWQLNAFNRSLAMIEFDMQSNIVFANENFLAAMGYDWNELQGKQHSLFVADEDRGDDYQLFWEALRRGEAQIGEVKRVDKFGKPVWLSATYNPIQDENGHFYKVIKLATVVTGRGQAISQVQQAMEAVARGDLTHPITDTFAPEFEPLKVAINQTINTLKKMVSQVSLAAGKVTTATEQIELGFQDLSERTERQSASLQQTAVHMDKLTQSSQTANQHSQEANKLAINASEKAQAGGAIVANAVTSMEGITESSRKINDIIGVIDEIAFQTNLLALNAAVEAARAGEQGRGFAVVAGEVRNLAQRSAAAAKEIKALIKDSVAKVEEGTLLVNDSGARLTEIVSAVKEASAMISRISETSEQQSQGIVDINGAMSEMDGMTQQNSALVKEATASSHSLLEQAKGMVEKLAVFNTGDAAPAPQKTHSEVIRKTQVKTTPPPVPPVKKAVKAAKAVTKTATQRPQSTPVTPVVPLSDGGFDDENWEEF